MDHPDQFSVILSEAKDPITFLSVFTFYAIPLQSASEFCHIFPDDICHFLPFILKKKDEFRYNTAMESLFVLCAKALLLALGLWQGLQFPDYEHMALCFFLALALSFSAPLFKAKAGRALPLILGCILPIFLPEILVFVPLFIFDAVYLGIYPAILPAGFVLWTNSPGRPLLFLVIIGGMTAALLAFLLRKITSLRRSLIHAKDEADENVMVYRAEQKARSEKQDAEVYAATLAERNRIAREIHDNVGHMLSRSILLTGALKTVHKEDEKLGQQLEVLDSSLNEAMNAIRESVHDLYEDSIDLEQAAGALAAEFSFCPVALDCRISSAVPRDISYCLLAIIKEALVNVGKHSSATQAHISITEHPALWQMSIEDNGEKAPSFLGHGIPSADAFSSPREGLGLKNMRQRVEQFSGTIHFSYDNGFRIFLTIPKERL